MLKAYSLLLLVIIFSAVLFVIVLQAQASWFWDASIPVSVYQFFLLFTQLAVAIGGYLFFRKHVNLVSHRWIRLVHVVTYILTTFAVAALSFITFGLVSLFVPTAEHYNHPSDCDPHNLTEVFECNGFGKFGFMNNYNYDIRALGTADRKICEIFKTADFSTSPMSQVKEINDFWEVFFLDSDDGQTCQLEDSAVSWAAVQCPALGDTITECYHCARGLANGNGHRYKLIGFSTDCTEGAYVLQARYGEGLLEYIQNLHSGSGLFDEPIGSVYDTDPEGLFEVYDESVIESQE